MAVTFDPILGKLRKSDALASSDYVSSVAGTAGQIAVSPTTGDAIVSLATDDNFELLLDDSATANYIYFQAANGTGSTSGGDFLVDGGAGGPSGGNGGALYMSGGVATEGNGGDVFLTAQNGAGTNRKGGDVFIYLGSGTGSGADGRFRVFPLGQGTNNGLLNFDNLTGARTFTFQDTTGTLALTSDLHDAVTLAGESYLSLSGQQITASDITLTTHVTGILPIANGGTNASSFGTSDAVAYYNGTSLVNSANLTFNGTVLHMPNATSNTTGFKVRDTLLWSPAANRVMFRDGSATVNACEVWVESVPRDRTLSKSAIKSQTYFFPSVTGNVSGTTRALEFYLQLNDKDSGTNFTGNFYGFEGYVTTLSGQTTALLVGGSSHVKNDATGTVTNAYGYRHYRIENNSTGHITNVYNDWFDVLPPVTANNQTRANIKFNAAMPTAGAFTGTTLAGIWFAYDSTTAINGLAWGASADTNLYRGAANVLQTDDGFDAALDVRGRQMVADGDNAGIASTNSLTNASDTVTAVTQDVFQMTAKDVAHTGFIKMYVGTTEVWVPYFTESG